jgi:hypothetical protein
MAEGTGPTGRREAAISSQQRANTCHRLYPWLILLFSAISPVRGADLTAIPSLFVDTPMATEGYFVLSWQTAAPAGATFILEQSNDPAFSLPVQSRMLVHAPDQASQLTITGLADGDYYFRLQLPSGEYSPALKVTVRHHQLSHALGFFGLGLAMFLTLSCAIFLGWWQTSRAAKKV